MERNETTVSRKKARWVIGVVTVCGLVIVGIAHLNVILSLLSNLYRICFPLLLGMGFSLILNIPMSFFERHLPIRKAASKKPKLRRLIAILLSLAAFIGFLVLIGVLVIPEMIEAVKIIADNAITGLDSLQQLENELEQTASPISELLSRININWSEIEGKIRELVNGQDWWTTVLNAAETIINRFVDISIGLFFAFHILFSKERLARQLRRFIQVWLPGKLGASLIHVAKVAGKSFHDFVVGQLTEAIILGTLCAIGMLILKIPYAPMVGAVISVTALIPILGAYIGAFIGAFMIFSVNPFQALVFLIYLVILQQFEGNLIYPRVVGAKIRLPGLWVFAAITIGGGVAGPFGMLIAVPVTATVYALIAEATAIRERRVSK